MTVQTILDLDEAIDLYLQAADAYHDARTRSSNARHHGTPRQAARANQAALDARMSAQQAGWQVKRGHSGTDRCPACREGT